MSKQIKYSPEVRERAVRLVQKSRGDHPSSRARRSPHAAPPDWNRFCRWSPSRVNRSDQWPFKKTPGSSLVPLGSEQKVDGVAGLVHYAIKILI
jgi:hypothetical protein